MDTHAYSGYQIPSQYDSMIGKLIVHGPDRATAIQIGRRALAELRVEGPGIQTTASLHRRLLSRAEFVNGQVDTGYLERFLES